MLDQALIINVDVFAYCAVFFHELNSEGERERKTRAFPSYATVL